VASYYFNAQVIQRSKGRSAVSAAAYRAAMRLHDERLGLTFDYERKDRVLSTEIMAPTDAPDWVKDRSLLWNAVEMGEGRKDAQVGREIVLALPQELPHEARLELARTFVRQQFVDRGMVADLALHETEDGNPHAHVMLTLRSLSAEGFGPKERAWNAKALLYQWREEWALTQNLALAHHGCLSRVDHRSFADRGIVLTPRSHLDKDSEPLFESEAYQVQLRRRADELVAHPEAALALISDKKPEFTKRDVSEWVAANVDAESADRVTRAILKSDDLQVLHRAYLGGETVYTTTREAALREAGALALAKPEEFLREFAQTNATFTERDLDRHLLKTVDSASFVKARAAIMALPGLIHLGAGTYTTKFELDAEYRLVDCADALAGRHTHAVGLEYVLPASRSRTMALEQELAYRHIVAGQGDIAVVQGFAGAGKSYMLGAAREAWEAAGYNVHGAALAGKAADGLQADAKIGSRTLASWELAWSQGRDRLTAKDVFVIDEAGMVGVAQLARVLHHVKAVGAKVVLVGDTEQLQAIEAGAGMKLVAERVGQAFISAVVRQKTEWMRAASREMGLGHCAEGLLAYREHGHFFAHETTEDSIRAVVAAWDKTRREKPDDSQLMLAFQRVHVAALNELARQHMRESGALGQNVSIKADDRIIQLARGDRVYFLKNDKALAVKNGTLGTVVGIANGKISVQVDGDEKRVVSFDPRTYGHFDYGYAATVHKSQGVTVNHAHVLASRDYESNVSYVALSRHKNTVTLHWDRTTFGDEKGLIESLSRQSTRRNALDFLDAYLLATGRTQQELELEAGLRRKEYEGRTTEVLEACVAASEDIAKQPIKARNGALDELPELVQANLRVKTADEQLATLTKELANVRASYASQCVLDAHADVLRTAAAWEKYKVEHPELVFRGEPAARSGQEVLTDYLRAFSNRENALLVCHERKVPPTEQVQAIHLLRDQDLAAVKSGGGHAPEALRAVMQAREAGHAKKPIEAALKAFKRPPGEFGKQLEAVGDQHLKAAVERERSLVALLELRSSSSLNEQAQRQVNQHNFDVRKAARDVVELKTVLAERTLLAAEQAHHKAAAQWLGFLAMAPNAGKLARDYDKAVRQAEAEGTTVEKILGRNCAMAMRAAELRDAERTAVKDLKSAQRALQRLDGRVPKAEVVLPERTITPIELREALQRHANAAKAWTLYAEKHPDEIWAARRDARGRVDGVAGDAPVKTQSEGARRYEAYIHATQYRAVLSAQFAKQMREKAIAEAQARIAKLEPELWRAFRPTKTAASVVAGKEPELAMKLADELNRERRELQRLVAPEKMLAKPEPENVSPALLRARLDEARTKVFGAAHGWELVKSDLPQGLIEDARRGLGPAALVYERAYAAQHEYHYLAKQYAAGLSQDQAAERGQQQDQKQKQEQGTRVGTMEAGAGARADAGVSDNHASKDESRNRIAAIEEKLAVIEQRQVAVAKQWADLEKGGRVPLAEAVNKKGEAGKIAIEERDLAKEAHQLRRDLVHVGTELDKLGGRRAGEQDGRSMFVDVRRPDLSKKTVNDGEVDAAYRQHRRAVLAWGEAGAAGGASVIVDARRGVGPAAAAYVALLEADAVRRATVARCIDCKLDEQRAVLDRAEAKHLQAVQALAAYRAAHPDALQERSGAPGAALRQAEYQAAKEMAQAAFRLDRGAVHDAKAGLAVQAEQAGRAEPKTLQERYAAAVDRVTATAQAWGKLKGEHPELVGMAREGRGEGASSYQAYRQACDERRACLIELAKEQEQRPGQRGPVVPYADPQQEFAAALKAAGLVLNGPPVMDGQPHRVPVEGSKPHSKDGMYVGHLDGVPAGYICNHRTGHEEKWRASSGELTPELRAQIPQKQAETVLERELAQARKANELRELWASAKPADPAHPYLVKKGVQANGLRQDEAGNLLVPLHDAKGALWNIQRISPEGEKRYSAEARKTGCFHVLGDLKGAKDVMICEGYATGATLHQASGKPVVVAMDAGNLKAAALAVREALPKAKIHLLADNDHQRVPNVGLEKAKEAALAVKGRAVAPRFLPSELKAGATDWNDLAKARGLRIVRAQLNNMIFKRDMGMQL
jgi:ATP-dependent exoDNAse (exonuclease V) alpha subunit/phage/plasmid primase-like uncharacterized protein